MAGTVTSTGLSEASSVLSLDIQNMTASTTIVDADLVVIDDGANGTLRKMTRAHFIESAALDAIDIDGGAIDGAVIGGATPAAATVTTLTLTSMGGNWTNAGRTIADLGTVTTADINGGTVDATIGATTPAAGTFTTLGVNNVATFTDRDVHSAGITLGEGTEIGVAANLDLMTLTSGGVAFTGNITTELALVVTSDARYKKNITPVSDAQDKLSELNPVNYDMRGDEFPTKGFNDKKQWGFIAQEVEKVMPELIHADKDGYRSMNYTGIIPLLTKAVQEQQTEMDKQQKEIDQLKAQLQSIMKMLDNDMSDKTDHKKDSNKDEVVKLSMATEK